MKKIRVKARAVIYDLALNESLSNEKYLIELPVSENDIREAVKKYIDIWNANDYVEDIVKEILSLLTGSECEKEGKIRFRDIMDIKIEEQEKSCDSCKHCQKQESGINHCKLKIIAESSAMFTDCIKKGFAKWQPKEEKRSCENCVSFMTSSMTCKLCKDKSNYMPKQTPKEKTNFNDYMDISELDEKAKKFLEKTCRECRYRKHFEEPKQPPKEIDWEGLKRYVKKYSDVDDMNDVNTKHNALVDIVRSLYEKVEGKNEKV